MSVYQLVLLNDILELWQNRKINTEYYISITRSIDAWALQQLEECNNKINQTQNLINEQICCLARAKRPPLPAQ